MPRGGKRQGAGHPPGVPSPGSGRKPESTKLRIGTQMLIWRTNAEGKAIGLGELWTVIGFPDRTRIEFSIDDGGKAMVYHANPGKAE